MKLWKQRDNYNNSLSEDFPANNLSKEDKWLIKKALNEYDLYNGECFLIYLMSNKRLSETSKMIIHLAIEISDSKEEEYKILDGFFIFLY